MKIPDNKEELLVWPPIGIGAVILVSSTLIDSLIAYNHAIQNIENGTTIAAYLFPVCMGIGIASSLNGKYWLGFGWLALFAYGCALITRYLSIFWYMGYIYAIFMCCAIMFVTQSTYLYFKRFFKN